jgi:hypothetical protein
MYVCMYVMYVRTYEWGVTLWAAVVRGIWTQAAVSSFIADFKQQVSQTWGIPLEQIQVTSVTVNGQAVSTTSRRRLSAGLTQTSTVGEASRTSALQSLPGLTSLLQQPASAASLEALREQEDSLLRDLNQMQPGRQRALLVATWGTDSASLDFSVTTYEEVPLPPSPPPRPPNLPGVQDPPRAPPRPSGPPSRPPMALDSLAAATGATISQNPSPPSPPAGEFACAGPVLCATERHYCRRRHRSIVTCFRSQPVPTSTASLQRTIGWDHVGDNIDKVPGWIGRGRSLVHSDIYQIASPSTMTGG